MGIARGDRSAGGLHPGDANIPHVPPDDRRIPRFFALRLISSAGLVLEVAVRQSLMTDIARPIPVLPRVASTTALTEPRGLNASSGTGTRSIMLVTARFLGPDAALEIIITPK
jgi:hypothetical protein